MLKFLNLEEQPAYSGSDLETAISDRLQQFLLELGMIYESTGIQTNIPSNSPKGYRRDVPATMIGHRGSASIRVAKPHMGASLPYGTNPKPQETGNELSWLQDRDGSHPVSAHNERLGSNEIGLQRRFAFFNQHRNDFGKIAPELVQILSLAMCSGKTRNMPYVQPCIGAALNDGRVCSLWHESPPAVQSQWSPNL